MTAYSPIIPPHDYGAVAVVDGQSIKITPLRTANVPPPMSLHGLEIQSNAIDVTFNVDASLLAVLHQDGLSIFEWKNVADPSSPPELTGRVTFKKSESRDSMYQQIAIAGKSEVLVLLRIDSDSEIQRYDFNDISGRMEELTSSKSHLSTACTLSSFCKDGSAHPFSQDRRGHLHSLDSAYKSLSHCDFPLYVPWVEVSSGEDEIAFGMSSNGHLYADSRLLVKNCTSFLVTPAHLIFTTTTHLLKFVHITSVNGVYSSFSAGVQD